MSGREKITHFDHERIPERVVHARGTGAYGNFRPYDDSRAAYTAAEFLTDPAITRPVFVRFSTVAGSRGSADTVVVRGATGDDLQADRAMNTMASVLYDAVVVPGGSESVQALSADGLAVHFVAEAFKHAKPVGAFGEGVDLLGTARVTKVRVTGDNEPVVADQGVVTSSSAQNALPAEFLEEFARALGKHRAWERDTAPVPA
jgi:putative intracellular protease/amidase